MNHVIGNSYNEELKSQHICSKNASSCFVLTDARHISKRRYVYLKERKKEIHNVPLLQPHPLLMMWI